MGIFKLPKAILRKLNQLLQSFWWGQSNHRSKIHWLSWQKLGKSKQKGGLGFRDFEHFNLALLAKQGWRIIQNPHSLVAQLSNLIQSELSSIKLWIENGTQQKVTQAARVNRWIAPPLDMFKANWDAAIDKINSRVGIGVIVRNSEGAVMASLCSSMDLFPDPLLGEAIATRRDSSFCVDLGFQHVILEGDSLLVVKAIQIKEDSWSDSGLVVRDIKILLSKFLSWSVLHVHKEVNVIAHHLAKIALSCQEDCIMIEDCPPCIKQLL
ncbi:uncharacterized protein LOC121265838 [Juglans microcarpa x Juglans regia]|uniref:uncharacterized protein LOC121265838 n=1 Tax=Juglans microcarpa x Juglans regia TaxID=2249226 RepID=UPI001B7E520B|nr:uncharacterized protein LOC121265838 [Juglans microcarpa x Juglans regia]